MNWFAQNYGTLIVVIVLLAVVAFAARKLIRDKKAGKSSCGCGCANCPMSGQCHKKPR
jgi:hypothetical protein